MYECNVEPLSREIDTNDNIGNPRQPLPPPHGRQMEDSRNVLSILHTYQFPP